MKALLLLIVILAASTTASSKSSQPAAGSKGSITDNLKKLKNLVLEKVKAGRAETADEGKASDKERKQKSLGYYSYYSRPVVNVDYSNLGYYFPQTKDFGNSIYPEEWLSRTEPFKRKNPQQLLDSPVYYVRLPPNPYVFVPGVGYVSRPPSLTDPELFNTIDNMPEKQPVAQDIMPSSFIHVPIDFVSNGKPTGVYQLPNDPIKHKPDSGLLNLNKGPYFFNGKPTDIYILRNSYNSMYADALTHFYP